MKRLSFLPFLVLSLGLRTFPATEPITEVCLAQLIKDAKDYQDQNVRVAGYLELRVDSDALFFSAEDEKEGRVDHALSVEFHGKLWKQRKHLTRNYVVLEGAFDGNRFGPSGMHAGALTRISKATIMSPEEVLQLQSNCKPPVDPLKK